MVQQYRDGQSEIVRSNITAAILSLTNAWMAAGRIQTISEIGSGQCYDFCDEIQERLVGITGIIRCETEDWWIDTFKVDIDKLKAAGQMPAEWEGIQNLPGIIGSATHAWISWNNIHFDATAPEGRDRFLDIPFFRDQIEKQAGNTHGPQEAH